MLSPLRGLLLDFGGVIADSSPNPAWSAAVAATVGEVLAAAGVPPLPPEAIQAGIHRDDRASDRAVLGPAPTQPDHAALWRDRIGAAWPAAARAAVAARAEELSRAYMRARHADRWELRPGTVELLADAQARGLPVAVVSNTLSGAVHREYLARLGLADRFAAQLYSDEELIRKPNPELARRAVAAVGVAAADCWFVGDSLSRDILVARRAGLGTAILMRSLRKEDPPHPDGVTPDAVVADPTELHTLLTTHW